MATSAAGSEQAVKGAAACRSDQVSDHLDQPGQWPSVEDAAGEVAVLHTGWRGSAMHTFAWCFAITFGIVLGAFTAVLLVAAVALVGYSGYSRYHTEHDRRADERARATAATGQATPKAAATAHQALAAATATAVRLAARQCEDPGQVVVTPTYQVDRAPVDRVLYVVSGTARNSCNFAIVVNLRLTGLAEDGSTILATKTIAMRAEDGDREGDDATLLHPGEERPFAATLAERPQPDIAAVRLAPVIIRAGDPSE